MKLNDFLNGANALLWGSVMPVLMIGIGVFLTCRLEFIQIRKFADIFRLTIGKLFQKNSRDCRSGITTWEAVSTALASTIGTGSIVGIAMAIRSGGAGSVFWMWVSALFGMAIKYVEIVLSIHYRERNRNGLFFGGPMYYLRKGLKSNFLSVLFSLCCLSVCFGMGNMVQSNAISSALKNQFNLNPYFTGTILLLFVSFVILGGLKRVGVFNARLVPLMSLLYIGTSVLILFVKRNELFGVFSDIFREAFSLPAAIGGVSSYGFTLALKNGFSKGLFSNEAGLGSAPIAHASGGADDAVEQGMWGMFEVFFTTIVICTLTALVVLTVSTEDFAKNNGAELAMFAFESALPNFGGICICASTVLFSLSSILGWAFYGEICIRFLFRNADRWILLYRLLFVFAVFGGSIGSIDAIWGLSELMNAFMAIPNLLGVVLLSKKSVEITRCFFQKKMK